LKQRHELIEQLLAVGLIQAADKSRVAQVPQEFSLANGKEALTRNGCGVMLSFYEFWLTLIFIPPVS
jgi:hypothetical protein